MSNRFPFTLSRSIPALLNGHRHFQTNRMISIFACNKISPVFSRSYIINKGNYSVEFIENMGQKYSTDNTQIAIPVVTYEGNNE